MQKSTKVILVGSNPSNTSPTTDPFHNSTKSRRFIDSWFDGLDVDVQFTNVVDYCTPNNRPLRIPEIKNSLPDLLEKVSQFDKVIALGRTAEKALDMLDVDFIYAPHPSGLNRFWNDADRSRETIEAIRLYVDGRHG